MAIHSESRVQWYLYVQLVRLCPALRQREEYDGSEALVNARL